MLGFCYCEIKNGLVYSFLDKRGVYVNNFFAMESVEKEKVRQLFIEKSKMCLAILNSGIDRAENRAADTMAAALASVATSTEMEYKIDDYSMALKSERDINKKHAGIQEWIEKVSRGEFDLESL
jgi:Lhr-like helicase